MRNKGQPCGHSLSQDSVYKEVVIIGNGPSGILCSYLLSGYAPHLKQIPDDSPIDEMLKVRLQHAGAGKCLLDLDLVSLAEGLEGRSNNPVPLLMDALIRPGADLGYDSEPLIEWRFDIDKQMDHIVLGKGLPGGSWHTFEPNIKCVSPAAWLALPPHANLPGYKPQERATTEDVAEYYRRYVGEMGLQRYFHNGVVVTSVSLRQTYNVVCPNSCCPLKAKWCVTGYDSVENRSFRYVCARVVLASGTSDRPNTCALPRTLASHKIGDLQRAICEQNRGLPVLVIGSGLSAADAVIACRSSNIQVIHVYRNTTNVLETLPRHVYPEYWQVSKMMADGKPSKYENYRPLPEHTVMEVTSKQTDTQAVTSVIPKTVKLLNLKTNEILELDVALILVLIGSKPDLHYLPYNFDLTYVNVNTCDKCCQKRKNSLKNKWNSLKTVLQSCKSRYWDSNVEINGNNNTKKCALEDCNSYSDVKCSCQLSNPFSNGLGFGVDPEKPIDCKKNPINIDKSSHEVVNAPSGLYALGPLTSDNFVRFMAGGAVAIVAHIWNDWKEPEG